jgi:hypothetical protein
MVHHDTIQVNVPSGTGTWTVHARKWRYTAKSAASETVHNWCIPLINHDIISLQVRVVPTVSDCVVKTRYNGLCTDVQP